MFQSTLRNPIGRFLGSRDTIILCGDSPNATVQIYTRNDDDNQYVLVNDVSINHYNDDVSLSSMTGGVNRFNSIEICYDNNANQFTPTIAVSTYNGKQSSIKFIKIDVNDDFNLIDANQYQTPSTTYAYTSLSFSDQCIDRTSSNQTVPLLASSSEDGNVMIFDLSTCTSINTFNADAAGLNQVMFAGNQVITVGRSPKHALSVWDLRILSNSDTSINNRQQAYKPSIAFKKINGNVYDSYTCVCSNIQAQTVVCGSENGSIDVWDLRKASMPVASINTGTLLIDQYSQISKSSEKITSVTYASTGDIIYSSMDGNVKKISVRSISGMYSNATSSNEEEVLMVDAAGMTSVDRIANYHGIACDCLLSTSMVGYLQVADI